MNTFPLDRVGEIACSPENYRLLERVPFIKTGVTFPLVVNDIHPDGVHDAFDVVFLDTETTGFSSADDKMIELGLVRASISPTHGVLLIKSAVSFFEDPGFPVPDEITRITGIRDEDVAGQVFDLPQIEAVLSGAAIVVAHNCSFDRPFFEARFSHLVNLKWADTMDVDWASLGYEGRKLQYLLGHRGYFYDGHRASIDCLAMAWLLACDLRALQQLLASEQAITHRVIALGAPFDRKDALKASGYNWNDGSEPGSDKAWYKVVNGDRLDAEKAFLSTLYRTGDRAKVVSYTSKDRFRAF